MSPRIWVDSDGCPAATLEALYRFAHESRVMLTLVSSRSQPWPSSAFIRSVVLAPGFAVGDRIAGVLAPGDVVVTGDKALTLATNEKNATAVNPRDGTALQGLLERTLGKKRAHPAAS